MIPEKRLASKFDVQCEKTGNWKIAISNIKRSSNKIREHQDQKFMFGPLNLASGYVNDLNLFK